MARERLSMRKVKEVLRLTHGFGLSQRQVARTCGVARSSVADYLARAERAGISWPLPDGMSEQELENKLFSSAAESAGKRALPDCAYIQRRRLFQRFNPLTFEEARHMETELARRLRKRGYGVWQN